LCLSKLFIFIIFSFILSSNVLNAEDEAVEGENLLTCELKLGTSYELDMSDEELASVVKAANKLQAYTAAVNQHLLERGEVLSLLEASILAGEHVLFEGPPGTAKTLIARKYLGNIQKRNADGNGSSSSYWEMQMTPDTTLSEIVGPYSPEDLMNNDRYRRLYDDGLLGGAHYALIDEALDGSPRNRRDILGAMVDRSHSQGTFTQKSPLEVIVLATNKYVAQVYEQSQRAGDPDGPRAYYDRIGLGVYIPKELMSLDSDIRLIQGKFGSANIPELLVEDVEELKAMVDKVQIPDSVANFLSMLDMIVGDKLSIIERNSHEQYQKDLRSAKVPEPQFISTKYHSKRTLVKAVKFLKVFILQDWIKSAFTRPLVASLEDLTLLEKFFTLNGPKGSELDTLIARSINPYEKARLKSIKIERDIYREIYSELMGEVNEVVFKTALSEIEEGVNDFVGKGKSDKKSKFIEGLLERWQSYVVDVVDPIRVWDNSGERIGKIVLVEYFEEALARLIGEDFKNLLAERKAELVKKVRQEEILVKERAQQAAEEARVAEAKRLRMKEQAEALYQKNKERIQQLVLDGFGESPASQPVVDLKVGKDINNIDALTHAKGLSPSLSDFSLSPSGRSMLYAGESKIYWSSLVDGKSADYDKFKFNSSSAFEVKALMLDDEFGLVISSKPLENKITITRFNFLADSPMLTVETEELDFASSYYSVLNADRSLIYFYSADDAAIKISAFSTETLVRQSEFTIGKEDILTNLKGDELQAQREAFSDVNYTHMLLAQPADMALGANTSVLYFINNLEGGASIYKIDLENRQMSLVQNIYDHLVEILGAEYIEQEFGADKINKSTDIEMLRTFHSYDQSRIWFLLKSAKSGDYYILNMDKGEWRADLYFGKLDDFNIESITSLVEAPSGSEVWMIGKGVKGQEYYYLELASGEVRFAGKGAEEIYRFRSLQDSDSSMLVLEADDPEFLDTSNEAVIRVKRLNVPVISEESE